MKSFAVRAERMFLEAVEEWKKKGVSADVGGFEIIAREEWLPGLVESVSEVMDNMPECYARRLSTRYVSGFIDGGLCDSAAMVRWQPFTEWIVLRDPQTEDEWCVDGFLRMVIRRAIQRKQIAMGVYRNWFTKKAIGQRTDAAAGGLLDYGCECRVPWK